jgi:hypothetical protein
MFILPRAGEAVGGKLRAPVRGTSSFLYSFFTYKSASLSQEARDRDNTEINKK